MKPTPDQKLWLKDYLFKVMQYRETYEEVYDHMLLAIEKYPEQQYFISTVLDILNNDFGGTNGLLDLEEKCRQTVESTAKNQFRDNFKRWLMTPLVIVTAVLFAGLFYLQLPYVKTWHALFILFPVLLILPTIICSARAAQLGYRYGENKASIKDEVFRKLAFTSNNILLEVILASVAVQFITNILFWFNDIVGMVAGVICIVLWVWPGIQRFWLRYKYNKHIVSGGSKYFNIAFRMLLLLSLTTKYIFKTEHWPSEKSISLNVIYAIVTAIFVLMIINVLAVINLYRSEFKTNMINA